MIYIRAGCFGLNSIRRKKFESSLKTRCAFGAAHSGKPPAYRQRASKEICASGAADACKSLVYG